MSNNKQSSIEYFKMKIVDIVEDYKDDIITLDEYIEHIKKATEKAKEIEKDQMIEFAFNALKIADDTMNGYVDVDKLYSETYGGNK